MQVRVLAIEAPRSFRGRDGGEVSLPARIVYIDEANRVDTDEKKGFFPLICACDDKVCYQVEQVPGMYELDFTTVPGKNSMPMMRITSAAVVVPFQD